MYQPPLACTAALLDGIMIWEQYCGIKSSEKMRGAIRAKMLAAKIASVRGIGEGVWWSNADVKKKLWASTDPVLKKRSYSVDAEITGSSPARRSNGFVSAMLAIERKGILTSNSAA